MALEPKTKTFAGIYESQGHYIEALSIYIDLLKENPLDEESADNIKRIQALIREKGDAKKRAAEAQISLLESFLQKTYAYKNA
jgi:Cu2+-containing amine oxidase